MPLNGDWAIFLHGAQDGLAECDQPGKNLLKYPATVKNWTTIYLYYVYLFQLFSLDEQGYVQLYSGQD